MLKANVKIQSYSYYSDSFELIIKIKQGVDRLITFANMA